MCSTMGWFPKELLDIELRQRLEAATMAGGAIRAARIVSFQRKILDMLESRRDSTGRIVVHYESDQMVYLREGVEWEFSSMSTQVPDNG